MGKRVKAQQVLSESTSLKPQIEDVIAEAYRSAKLRAARETQRLPQDFPESCPFAWDDVLNTPIELPD